MEDKLLQIIKYGDDILHLKAKEVTEINGKTVEFIRQMLFTLHNTPTAIGLAAPQVNESLMISVIDLSQGEKEDEIIVLINPEIVEAEGKELGEEGCLSFPKMSMNINRSTRILLKNTDINGNERKVEVTGFLARVIQHEIDHLNGTLILDRVSSLKRQFVKKEISRRFKIGDW